jgi:hypothetical protein
MRKWLGCAAAAIATAALLSGGSAAFADPVAQWHTLKAAPATVVDSGQGTNDPVIGNLITTSSASRIVGYFTPRTLTNVGDLLTLSYTVSLNDATGMADGADNWRFALFDRNGEAPLADENTAANGTDRTDGLRGYWFGVDTIAAGAQGSMRERTGTTADQDPFANASATLLGNAGGTAVDFTSSVNGDGAGPLYQGIMTLELTAGGLSLSGSFGNATHGMNTFSFLDDTPVTTTFGAVGFLNGGALSVDQVILRDVEVTLVPEPSSLALAGAGGLALLRRRRT